MGACEKGRGCACLGKGGDGRRASAGEISMSSTSVIRSASASRASSVLSKSSRAREAACSVPSSASMVTFFNEPPVLPVVDAPKHLSREMRRKKTIATASTTTAAASANGPTARACASDPKLCVAATAATAGRRAEGSERSGARGRATSGGNGWGGGATRGEQLREASVRG